MLVQQQQADVEVLDEHTGLRPLHVACMGGRMDAARALLHCKAALDVKERRGYSPLALACRGAHVETARYLLSARAEVDAEARDQAEKVYAQVPELQEMLFLEM